MMMKNNFVSSERVPFMRTIHSSRSQLLTHNMLMHCTLTPTRHTISQKNVSLDECKLVYVRDAADDIPFLSFLTLTSMIYDSGNYDNREEERRMLELEIEEIPELYVTYLQ